MSEEKKNVSMTTESSKKKNELIRIVKYLPPQGAILKERPIEYTLQDGLKSVRLTKDSGKCSPEPATADTSGLHINSSEVDNTKKQSFLQERLRKIREDLKKTANSKIEEKKMSEEKKNVSMTTESSKEKNELIRIVKYLPPQGAILKERPIEYTLQDGLKSVRLTKDSGKCSPEPATADTSGLHINSSEVDNTKKQSFLQERLRKIREDLKKTANSKIEEKKMSEEKKNVSMTTESSKEKNELIRIVKYLPPQGAILKERPIEYTLQDGLKSVRLTKDSGKCSPEPATADTSGLHINSSEVDNTKKQSFLQERLRKIREDLKKTANSKIEEKKMSEEKKNVSMTTESSKKKNELIRIVKYLPPQGAILKERPIEYTLQDGLKSVRLTKDSGKCSPEPATADTSGLHINSSEVDNTKKQSFLQERLRKIREDLKKTANSKIEDGSIGQKDTMMPDSTNQPEQ